jgi:hypothetical protein
MNPDAAPRSRRRATERDFHFFQNPSLWRTHPFLPLTRCDLSGRPELGVLFDARSFGLHGYVSRTELWSHLFPISGCMNSDVLTDGFPNSQEFWRNRRRRFRSARPAPLRRVPFTGKHHRPE